MLPENIKNAIVKTLKSIDPDKVILFGSYAYGKPLRESDIDLLIIKDIPEDKVREIRIEAKKLLWQQFRNKSISFDVLVDSESRIKSRIPSRADLEESCFEISVQDRPTGLFLTFVQVVSKAALNMVVPLGFSRKVKHRS